MVVGVDVSSRRVDLAWLENGKPCRWHQELGKGHLIDRLREIRVEWPTPVWQASHMGVEFDTAEDVTDIAIEKPFSTSRRSTAALSAVAGIITRQAPPWARVAWPSSGELRAAIGARNTKASAHLALIPYAHSIHAGDLWDDACVGFWDEHELDALIACIGWTRILEQQEAA